MSDDVLSGPAWLDYGHRDMRRAPVLPMGWTTMTRRYPMPTACSPWCLVHRDDPDKRKWRRCTHRRRK